MTGFLTHCGPKVMCNYGLAFIAWDTATMPVTNSKPMPPPGKRKDPKSLYTLSKSPVRGRFAVVNHYRAAVSRLEPVTKYPRLQAFLPQNLWPWVWSYLKHLGPKCRFRSYKVDSSNKDGLYRMTPGDGQPIRIAIAGDWATGTDESWQIAQLMTGEKPDLTIHLGDVYYVGGDSEIKENCLGQAVDAYTPVEWPKGARGSFALNGNHEMYANGGPYFQTLLPRLGMTGDLEGQVASIFSLETDAWRILAIDTGYNSTGIPILSQLPWVKEIPFIGGDCHLEDDLLDWLRTTVRPEQNRKATLLLSHHQYFSAFPEQSYTKRAKQLAQFFPGQELVWIWGHEHRLAFYDKFTTPEGLVFHGRCVGHSGMPVEMADPERSAEAPLILYDTRTHTLDGGIRVGQNGYVLMTLRGPELTFDYRDISNTQLLVETFRPAKDATLNREVVTDPKILTPLFSRI